MDLSKYSNMNLDVLKENQKKIFLSALEGKKQSEIAQMYGCSRQNINTILNTCCRVLDSRENKKAHDIPKTKKTVSNPHPCKRDYDKYIALDLSVLTDAEKNILMLKQSGKSYSDIAKILGVTASTIGVRLSNIIDKLEGREIRSEVWRKENQDIINAQRRNNEEYIQKSIELHKDWYEKNKDRLCEYNRQYYLENREKILDNRKRKRNMQKNE